MVGLTAPDDAAVYRMSDDQAIISTADFFPPIVDDPYTFGQIAAANALSDVYAMGGEPLFALNLAGFPDNLDLDILSRIFLGGADKVLEAGAVIAGGHTVTDEEPKYGLSVTGQVHPDRIFTKAGAQPGDILVLTKPIGTGVITTAHKRDCVEPAHLVEAVASMCRLNGGASRLLQQFTVHACTDVTGYGLLGHAMEMARHGNVRFEFAAQAISAAQRRVGLCPRRRGAGRPRTAIAAFSWMKDCLPWRRTSRPHSPHSSSIPRPAAVCSPPYPRRIKPNSKRLSAPPTSRSGSSAP